VGGEEAEGPSSHCRLAGCSGQRHSLKFACGGSPSFISMILHIPGPIGAAGRGARGVRALQARGRPGGLTVENQPGYP